MYLRVDEDLYEHVVLLRYGRCEPWLEVRRELVET